MNLGGNLSRRYVSCMYVRTAHITLGHNPTTSSNEEKQYYLTLSIV